MTIRQNLSVLHECHVCSVLASLLALPLALQGLQAARAHFLSLPSPKILACSRWCWTAGKLKLPMTKKVDIDSYGKIQCLAKRYEQKYLSRFSTWSLGQCIGASVAQNLIIFSCITGGKKIGRSL